MAVAAEAVTNPQRRLLHFLDCVGCGSASAAELQSHRRILVPGLTERRLYPRRRRDFQKAPSDRMLVPAGHIRFAINRDVSLENHAVKETGFEAGQRSQERQYGC